MTDSALRHWWQNCVLKPDPDILEIDLMEDRLSPLSQEILHIRELISYIELCHHKAEDWIGHIIDAIGAGKTSKGPGTADPGRVHPAAGHWQAICDRLTAWCEGRPDETAGLSADFLGLRSDLKEWQVGRVVEKIRSVIPAPPGEEQADYEWLLLSIGEDDNLYREKCPECYGDHCEFWERTARTIIHDREDGRNADLSLALAIDMLWPCHWNFEENLRIVLEAIGGYLDPEMPFTACGRNIALIPTRKRLEELCAVLAAYCSRKKHPDLTVGSPGLSGEPTEEKIWLAASLEKTIRLQLDPPADIRKISALAGPEWI